MDCHPVRVWKIVYPPTTFNREEKFFDLQIHMEPNMQVVDDAPLLPYRNVSKRRTDCNPPEPVPVERRHCSVCQKVFGSMKSMFRNMDCHPVRVWKIVYPPTSFNREENFFDLLIHMEPNMQVVDDAPLLPDLNVSKRRTDDLCNPPEPVPVEQRRCSVCQKVSYSVKSMFGNMNCHPVRVWKIVYPPTTFNREEKFFDLQIHMELNMQVVDDAPLMPDLNVSKRRTDIHMEPNMQVADDAPLLPDLNVSKRRTDDLCNPPEPVPVEQRRCSVCQKVSYSVKSMFGNMNCHPVRVWKIVYPPTTFNKEEKFFDLQIHMEPNMQVADDAPLRPDLNVSKRRTDDLCNPPEPVPVEQRRCSVCQKVSYSVKSMFGNMNCHPVRVWKIVYPPTTFNKEEKFFDLQIHMEPNMQVADDAPLLRDLNVSKRRTDIHMEPNMQVADDAPLLPDLNVSKRRMDDECNPPEPVPVERRRCSVCQKVYDLVKSMFGNMNCHPVRVWKIVYPPTTFNKEEKFFDLQIHMEPNMQVADDAPLLPDLNVSKRRTDDLCNPPEPVPVEQRRCSVCQKVYDLVKSMFGNMNCHPVRVWKIVYPPTTFNREEKFFDLQIHMEPNMQVADDAPLLPDLNVSKRRMDIHMEPNMQVADDAPLLPDLNVSKRRTDLLRLTP
ncbi:hypothetical protein RND71_002156 [Anisodus tanguticus]|uniref:Uncharacterized protein n=1 Tax=Anisodus tanguticus TaxID=243964 RepID=A0AAE1T0L2_9SOLA|nr:hypothetical protein RND71_002156 [Anisodus tanguticus]